METLKVIDPKLENEKPISDVKYFPQKSFLAAIIGPVYSGKSYLCYQVVSSFYKLKYDYIYIMSVNKEYQYNVKESDIRTEFDLPWFYNKITMLKLSNDQLEKQNKPLIVYDIMLLIDDFASDLKKLKQTETTNLFLRRRHFDDRTVNGKTKHYINLSIILTSQYYRLLNPIIRTQLTSCIFFSLPFIEINKLFEEMVKVNIKSKDFLQICEQVFAIPYSAVQIRMDVQNEFKYTVIRQNEKKEYVITILKLK